MAALQGKDGVFYERTRFFQGDAVVSFGYVADVQGQGGNVHLHRWDPDGSVKAGILDDLIDAEVSLRRFRNAALVGIE